MVRCCGQGRSSDADLQQHRRRDDSLPSQTPGRVAVEVAYTLGSLALVLAIFGYATYVQYRVDDSETDPDLVVEVVGFNWQWQFAYADTDVVVIRRASLVLLAIG